MDGVYGHVKVMAALVGVSVRSPPRGVVGLARVVVDVAVVGGGVVIVVWCVAVIVIVMVLFLIESVRMEKLN